MSKAFTRESDDAPDEPLLTRPASALPAGAKNYITASGMQRLRHELDRLVTVERPQIQGLATDAESRHRLQLMDHRIRQVQQSIQSAEVVSPPPMPWDQVRFGATVTVRNRNAVESQYRIVGLDETDLDRDWVSWLSPIARALLGAKIGQRIRFRFPAGEEELEIIRIAYE